MKQFFVLTTALIAFAGPSYAQNADTMTVRISGITDGTRIPEHYAFCAADERTHTRDGGNVSPSISWATGPEGTKSYAIIMHDPDVPTIFDDANQEGKSIDAGMPRQEFYHWVLLDIPPEVTELGEGVESENAKTRHPAGKVSHGVRGVNDYGKFTGGAPYGGYAGPCPPWNDRLVHRYFFDVYALDVATLDAPEGVNGEQALKLMEGHVLAKGTLMGTYTQNISLK